MNKWQRQKNTKKNALILTAIIAGLLTTPSSVYAAGGTIGASPSTGSSYTVNTPFTVDIIIDGDGEAFNAAKASVKTTPSLQINDLILGDCNFSFVKTPSTTEPSFAGVILGNSSKKCTLYTLNVTPLSEGTGRIDITDTSIKRYGDAAEILGGVQNGTYTVGKTESNIVNSIMHQVQNATGNNSAPAPTGQNAQPTVTQQTTQTAPSSYTLSLNVLGSDNKPLSGATVVIDPPQNNAPVPATNTKITTNKNGTAQISNMPPGMHVVRVESGGKPIVEKIMNVSGNNPVMVLSIQQQKQPVDWSMIALIGIIVFILMLFILDRSHIFNRIKQKVSHKIVE